LHGEIIKKKTPQKKYLFITHEETKGWILDAKAKRLSSHCPLEPEDYFTNNYKSIPDAEGYFFLHQMYFARVLRYNPHRNTVKSETIYTWKRKTSKK
jgi:hypothetical protein